MPRIDLSPHDPADPANLAGLDLGAPLPDSDLARHPYVRRLLREMAALREANQRLTELQREMISRDLIAARRLEPLNPAPVGRIAPANGVATVLHVDNLRLLANRVRGEQAPTIRILVGGLDAAPLHAHWVRLGPSELRERPLPLPGRSAALVVLDTDEPVDVLQ